MDDVRTALFKLRLEPLHDYDDKGTWISHLGLWDDTLEVLRSLLPTGWRVVETRRVLHPQGHWLRVDLLPPEP